MAAAGRVQVVPQITQETFDQVVRENIEDFEMSPDEAVDDAAAQFKSQGVDLSNILLRPPADEAGGEEPHPVLAALNEYMAAISPDDPKSTSADGGRSAATVTSEIKDLMKERAVRLLVGNSGGIAVMLAGCEKFCSADQIAGGPDGLSTAVAAVEVLCALLQEQGDLIGPVQSTCLEATAGETAKPTPEITRMCDLLKATSGIAELQAPMLKACRLGCFMHESNRQAFVAAGLVELALSAAETHAAVAATVAQAMLCVRAVTKDDDPRVPFGRANEHVKAICTEYRGLERLLEVLRACHSTEKPDPLAGTEVFKTLSQLAMRDEYCKRIVDLGVLDYVLPALDAFPDEESVAYSGCTLLRAVAGNDEVKRIIGAKGGVALIVDTMQKQLRSEKVAEQGAAALAALQLKTPSNATQVAAVGGPHVLVKIMHMHPGAVKLQRQACMAIRNCVVRNRELVDGVLGQGAEAVLNAALTAHKECRDEAKAALRDLGCKVELKERWTGALKKDNLDLDGSERS